MTLSAGNGDICPPAKVRCVDRALGKICLKNRTEIANISLASVYYLMLYGYTCSEVLQCYYRQIEKESKISISVSHKALLEISAEDTCVCETPCNVTRYGKELSMVKIPSKGSARYLSRKYHKSEEYIR